MHSVKAVPEIIASAPETILTCCSDQCAQQCALVAHLIRSSFRVTWIYDGSHRIWNDGKSIITSTGILSLKMLMAFFQSPFRSGRFFKTVQMAAARAEAVIKSEISSVCADVAQHYDHQDFFELVDASFCADNADISVRSEDMLSNDNEHTYFVLVIAKFLPYFRFYLIILYLARTPKYALTVIYCHVWSESPSIFRLLISR